MKITITYVPCPNHETALSLAEYLISNGLVACANVIASESAYHWEGKMCKEKEWIALLKSPAKGGKFLAKAIKRIHPYSIPAILQWKVKCNKA